MKSFSSIPIFLLLAFVLFPSQFSFSQQSKNVDDIIENFTSYTKTPREVTYAHLNKSTYIKGETIGFTVYVFDKYKKQLSQVTTNLYCSIEDQKGNIVKSKLLLVENGVSHDTFYADSLFTSGNYTFKAYTNFMRNFSEQNSYVQNITIMDPESPSESQSEFTNPHIDAQFLPEGGHMLSNTENTIGVIIKNATGHGIPNLKGQILNTSNEQIVAFETNNLGIGKFTFTPKSKETYRASINVNGTSHYFNLLAADNVGIAMSLTNLRQKSILKLSTNETSSKQIQNKNLKLAIHNGHAIKIINVAFKGSKEILLPFNHKDLSPGINVFTLFDNSNKPILERVFFNHEGMEPLKLGDATYQKSQDSTTITLPIPNLNANNFHNFSISVLPSETKSYNHNHSIISQNYLRPYIKGPIENAGYYFTDIEEQRKLALDNLLITQGWSSYDWNGIFNQAPQLPYEFEVGISFRANVVSTKTGQFMMYPLQNNASDMFEASQQNASFEKGGLFPYENEKIRLGEISRTQIVEKPTLYLQFIPSEIPNYKPILNDLPPNAQPFKDLTIAQVPLKNSWTNMEELEEVIVTATKKQIKKERLITSPFHKVETFTDLDRRQYQNFETYINTRGYIAYQYLGTYIIKRGSTVPRIFDRDSSNKSQDIERIPFMGSEKGVPEIYIDDRLLMDFNELLTFDMTIVDYIAIDRHGFQQGLKYTGGGEIKIYTDPLLKAKNQYSKATYQEVDIPLTFSVPKKFYTPKYRSYTSQFYKENGVVNWLPNCQMDAQGNISFKIDNTQTGDLKIFIEGTCNDGSLISEVKQLQIN